MNSANELDSFVLVDLKHGLALFFGTREEMGVKKESICSRCRSYGTGQDVDSFLHILSRKEAGDIEYEYMVTKRVMPRRLMMRLTKGSSS